jgi:hypothetical protein
MNRRSSSLETDRVIFLSELLCLGCGRINPLIMDRLDERGVM